MRLTSIETTPNPNSMKCNLDVNLGRAVTYKAEEINHGCPEFVLELLRIGGLKSIFVCHDFITLNRDPRMDWKQILDAATYVLSGSDSTKDTIDAQRQAAEKNGQVEVLVQTFRGIPLQVKAVDAQDEKRLALEKRFTEAAQLIQKQTGADFLKERYWANWGVRYGTVEEVATEVINEIVGTYGEADLKRLTLKAVGDNVEAPDARPIEVIAADLKNGDWTRRLQAVQELGVAEDAIPHLVQALGDTNHQVRRLAAAALGASGSHAAVAALCNCLLNDPSVGVRRTAGDALSDLGDQSAQPSFCRALSDPNKLVRWRAARFLTDLGDEGALPFLEKATTDSEFEVRLEAEAALERIRGGHETSVPAWKKILNQTESAL
jgi:hypothetical protein